LSSSATINECENNLNKKTLQDFAKKIDKVSPHLDYLNNTALIGYSKDNSGMLEQRKEIQMDKANIKSATYFDIAVMRCLLCPRWNHEGYLWALEYLSYRVNEITEFTLKEQDQFFKLNSESVPTNINQLYKQIKGSIFDCELNDIKYFNMRKNYSFHPFIDLINFICYGNDLTNSKYKFLFNYSKRKKFESNFDTRIR
jgi:hypothetical protein